ncbi:MAG: YbaB/EbfC family nucleoid-associated protein [Myxococcaceae bacterium]
MFDFNKLSEMVKNATQIQEKLSRELASKTVESSAGGGMVKIVMNGQFEVVSLDLDSTLISMNDVSFTQDLLKSAINDATKQVKQLMADQARSLSSQFNLPTS